jgi:hypothetical protein
MGRVKRSLHFVHQQGPQAEKITLHLKVKANTAQAMSISPKIHHVILKALSIRPLSFHNRPNHRIQWKVNFGKEVVPS